MKIVGVSNDNEQLEVLYKNLQKGYPDCEWISMTDPLMSAKYICNNEVDYVLIEVKMRPVDGFDLLRVLRRQKPTLPIALMSDLEAYGEFAIKSGADQYLLRPFDTKDI